MSDDMVPSFPQAAVSCPGCGSEIAPRLLCCPSCRRLVHGARLKELSEAADDAEDAGDFAGGARSLERSRTIASTREPAVQGHRRAYRPSGPPGRGQSDRAPLGTSHAACGAVCRQTRTPVGAAAGIIGSIAIAAWKLKLVGVLLLTKGKLLLLGLTKATTVVSMMASLGVYWTVFGGWLPLGLVVSIYIHEMGHVFVLTRYGVRASAPLFVPGLGGFHPAQTGHGRPKTGCAGRTRRPDLGHGGGACVRPGLPVDVQADLGGHCSAWRVHQPVQPTSVLAARRCPCVSQPEPIPARWLAVASIATAWAATDQHFLVLLLAVAGWHTVMTKPNDEPDAPILAQYAILIMILSVLTKLPVPLPV